MSSGSGRSPGGGARTEPNMPVFGFIGGAYTSESLHIDAQQCVNLYVEQDEATKKAALYGTPGIHTWATLPTTPVRALWAGEDRLFAVGGTELYEVSAAGAVSASMGSIWDDDTHSPVQIFPSGDGTQIFIVSAGYAWVHNGVSVIPAPVPPDPAQPDTTPGGQEGTAIAGAFLDSAFFATKANSRLIYQSAINNAAVWDPLDVFTKESYPDNVRTILTDHTELWVFGTHQSTEVWRNESDATEGAVMRRDPGAHFHFAGAAMFSAVNLEGPAWLGSDTRGRVGAFRAQGFSPVRVSTHAVENEWAKYSLVTDAISWVQWDKGHKFWWITFPTGNATWVYDMSTNVWHQRGYWNGTSLDRHRARCGANVFGKFLVGDHTSGKIYEMHRDFFDDDGAAIRRVRSAPHINEERKRAFYHSFQLDLEVDTDSAPDVIMDYSRDGGHTWSTPRTLEPSLASRRGRVIARRLGSDRQRTFRTTITDQKRVAIVDAYVKASPAAG